MSNAEEIKAALDIVDLISETVDLKDCGGDEWKGALNPGSKSGKSLNVNKAMQVWHDWPTDTGGSVLDWIAHINNIDINTEFNQVLAIAAEKAGLTLDTNGSYQETNEIFTVLRAAAQWCHNQLTPDLRKHTSDKWGISDETMDKYLIGYAPGGEDSTALQKALSEVFTAELIRSSGLFIATNRGWVSQYQDRIVFPYWKGGNVVYSIARSMEENTEDKYLKQLTNTTQKSVDPSIKNVIFGQDSLMGADHCVITEGVTDCLAVLQAGIPCVSPVTVRFQKDDYTPIIKLAKDLKTVYVCNDNEESKIGDDGAQSTAELLRSEGVDVHIIQLPRPVGVDKIDLADFLRDNTADDFKELMQGAAAQDTKAAETCEPEKYNLTDIQAMRAAEVDNRLRLQLPEGHFITTSCDWLDSLSDGYNEYKICAGLWALSALTRGKAVLRLRQEVIQPNLNIILIGESTKTRKSTIINKTRNIYESATDKKLYNEDYSIEGYLETLSIDSNMNHVRDEVGGLFAKFKKKYNDGIFDLECALYDGQNFKKTLAGGKNKTPKTFEVENPYVTKFYATTPDNFARYLTIDDFLSGYGLRFLFAFPKYQKERKPLELETQEDIDRWAEVLTRIKKMKFEFDEIGEINFDVYQDAMAFYNEVCEKLEDMAESQNNNVLSSAVGRSQVHILKIAMLLEIGKKEMSFKIDKTSMAIAANMVINFFLPCLMDMIDRLQEDIKYNQIEKIISVLRRLGGVAQHSKLLHDTKIKSRDFMECIETMLESEAIKAALEEGSNKKYYILKNGTTKNIKIPSILQIPKIPPFSQSNSSEENLENSKNLTELDTNIQTCGSLGRVVREPENLENLENRENSDIVNVEMQKSQYDYGQTAMDMINDWYPKRPEDPVVSRSCVVDELAGRTGISKETAYKHVTAAFKAKGWT